MYRFGLLSDLAYARRVKTIHTPCHLALIRLLKEKRRASGIRQVEVAKKMRKQQNWMSRIEKGDRRLDVCQFLQLADLIGFDPVEALRSIEQARNKNKRK